MSQTQSCVRYLALALALGGVAGAASPCAALTEDDLYYGRAMIGAEYRSMVLGPYPSQSYFRQSDGGREGADGLSIHEWWRGPEGRGVYLWTRASGAHYIYGPLLETWVALGAESGLGYPTTSERRAADRVGELAHFARVDAEGGRHEPAAIVTHPELGTHAIYGAIYGLWNLQGTEPLLYPTDDEHDVTAEEAGTCAEGDRAQSFRTLASESQTVICWNEQEGARLVSIAPAPSEASE